jgi:hypothetical protein
MTYRIVITKSVDFAKIIESEVSEIVSTVSLNFILRLRNTGKRTKLSISAFSRLVQNSKEPNTLNFVLSINNGI